MDPLSVAASIVGLLTAAASITSLIYRVSTASIFSGILYDILQEVEETKIILGQIQTFFVKPETVSRSGAALLLVEQIIVVLTTSVMTYSKLEKTIEPLRYQSTVGGATKRWEWTRKKSEVSRLFQRVQSSKTSLNLMLTILVCSSMDEAQSSAMNLTMLVEQILNSNKDMSRRIASMERRSSSETVSYTPSIPEDVLADGDDASTIKPQMSSVHVTPLATEEQKPVKIKRARSSSFTGERAFEQDLVRSQVYMRVFFRRGSSLSFPSSTRRTIGWSYLSGLSLAEISQISVLSLPITPAEVWRPSHYLPRSGKTVQRAMLSPGAGNLGWENDYHAIAAEESEEIFGLESEITANPWTETNIWARET